MKITLDKENQVHLIKKDKKLLIGKLEGKTLNCVRKSALHIFRKYNSICFNSAVLKLKLDKIVVLMDGDRCYTISLDKLIDFTNSFDAVHNFEDEQQIMIPISLFEYEDSLGRIEKSKSVDMFKIYCGDWKKRLKDNDYG